MTNWINLTLLTVAGIMIVTGFLLQHRALARYGKQPRPRGVIGYWNCAELFDDRRGMRLYLQGDALMSWGLMVYFSIFGYLAGRD